MTSPTRVTALQLHGRVRSPRGACPHETTPRRNSCARWKPRGTRPPKPSSIVRLVRADRLHLGRSLPESSPALVLLRDRGSGSCGLLSQNALEYSVDVAKLASEVEGAGKLLGAEQCRN